MTVNQKIENTLSDLVDGNIWPNLCPLETLPDAWITYTTELDAPAEFGDDTDLEWVQHMQVHWFKKGYANTLEMRMKLRVLLKEAGFCISGFETMADAVEKGRVTHLICHCNIIEEAAKTEVDNGEDDDGL